MKTQLRWISAITGIAVFSLPASAQSARRPVVQQVSSKPSSVSADTVASNKTSARDSLGLPRRPTPRRQQFWFENGITNVYDSNIEHDSTNIGSYGVVVGASGRYRSARSRPAVQLEYGVAVHQYTATDKWDRVSQLARAGVDMPLGSVLLVGLTGEGYLKGSSEDREIGDQYALIPRIEIRPVDDLRLRVIGAYRRRYFENAPGSNATNKYVTFDSRLRMRAGTLEGAARFEENRPKTTRFRFFRQTYTGRYTFPLSDDDDLLLGLEYRPVRYPDRTVDLEDGDGDNYEVVRQDRRWKPQVRWSRKWTRNLLTDLEYEYEMRFSNDPDKRYRGHVITFATVVEW